MVLLLWKLMTLIAFLSSLHQVSGTGRGHPKAEIKNPLQHIVDDGHPNFTVTLDGSPSNHADRYRWNMIESPPKGKTLHFSARRQAVTNVTIGNEEGLYRFQLRASATEPGGRKIEHSDAFSRVYIEKPSSVGMYLFASNVVKQLIKMQYQYIALSQYHQRATHYHPNVIAYFKKFATDRAKMLDDVTEHVLAKQATKDLINSCPTDYVKVMLSGGFIAQVDFNANVTDFMTSGFEIALQSEAKLARELSEVAHYAEKNHDYELAEFVAADLLPRVTKVMNIHKSHLETTLRPANTSPTSSRHLVEFLFDKHLKI